MTSQPPFLQKLTLKGFRSLREEAVEFDNPTFLVGTNGAGKSNLADAVAFLSDCAVNPLQSVFARRGGIRAVLNRRPTRHYVELLGLRADFRLAGGRATRGFYAFEIRDHRDEGFAVQREQCVMENGPGQRIWFDRKQTAFQSNILGVTPAIDPQALALPVVGGVGELAPLQRALASMRVYAIDPARIREPQDPDSGLILQRDGSNLASVLRKLSALDPEVINWIGMILSTVTPGIIRVRPVTRGNKLTLAFDQEWTKERTVSFDAGSVSDGTLRVLGIVTAVVQQPTPSLILIEEPEATIHPGALGTIQNLIQIGAERSQVIVTTHSPELLDAKWIEASHLRVVSWENGTTFVYPLGAGAVAALQQHLMSAGELLRVNALDATLQVGPAPAPLFDNALV